MSILTTFFICTTLSINYIFLFNSCRIKQELPDKGVLEQEMAWMKEHLSQLGSPVVLCHNDLLCKNIIHNAKEGKQIHLKSLFTLLYNCATKVIVIAFFRFKVMLGL